MATIEVMPARLTREETDDLRRAVACLEGASFAQRLTDTVGRPIERAEPRRAAVGARGGRACERERAARRAEAGAAHDRPQARGQSRRNRAHKSAAAASGAFGGAFGLAALPVELPISTTILLRSIAEIAREEGEDLSAPEASLACIEVFALGGQEEEEAVFESGYFAVRAALAKSVSDSARFVAAEGLSAQTAPVGGAADFADRGAIRGRRQRESSRPRRRRSSARSAAPRSTPPSPTISRRWRAAISSCAGSSAAHGREPRRVRIPAPARERPRQRRRAAS